MHDLFAITLSPEKPDEYNLEVIAALLDNVNQEANRLGSVRKITVLRGMVDGSKNKFIFVCEINGVPGTRIFTDVGRAIISSEDAMLEHLGSYDEFASWPREEDAASTSNQGRRGLSLSDE